jgi:hypothetical protein
MFGDWLIDHLLHILVPMSTALIFFTAGNTRFNGFPALARFLAEDGLLSWPLMRSGQRLVFANAVITQAVLAVARSVFTDGSVTALVPFCAIRVRTGFSMADPVQLAVLEAPHHGREPEAVRDERAAASRVRGAAGQMVYDESRIAQTTR